MTTVKQVAETLPSLFENRREYQVVVRHDQTEVTYGYDNDVNKEYCDKNNIPYYNLHRAGGAIVHSKGNVAIFWLYRNDKYKRFMLEKALADLKNYLNGKGIACNIEKNDILVDGYKVASTAGYNLKPDYKWTLDGMQISINQDIDKIENICLKPMVKVPKGLSEYGITTAEIVEWCDKWMADNTFE